MLQNASGHAHSKLPCFCREKKKKHNSKYKQKHSGGVQGQVRWNPE